MASLRWLARSPVGPGAVSVGNDITAFRTVPVGKERGEVDKRGWGREGGGPEGIGIGEGEGEQNGPGGGETEIVVVRREGERRVGGEVGGRRGGGWGSIRGGEEMGKGEEVGEGEVEGEEKREGERRDMG